MSAAGTTGRRSDHVRQFGRIFADLSVDQAARKCVRAAVSWGGNVVVFVDQTGLCSALIGGTGATDKAVKAAPGDFVGAYSVTHDDYRRASNESRELIAWDILEHWMQIKSAAAE